ncbi:MAG: RagB/SusD family nutrient uptake outer membrane protein [Rikenellaceae bacterium]
MKIRNVIKIFALSAAVVFTSCDDFLDQESISQASTTQMYTSILDCEYGLAAMYNALKAPNAYDFTDNMMRSDMAVQGNRTNITNNAYMQDFTNAFSASSNMWAALYQIVFRANQLLEGADLLGESLTTDSQVETLNFYRAQAHFIRGLAYFWLHNSYNGGSIPLVTKASTTPEDIYVPCSTHNEVRDFYRADFRDAAFTYGEYMYDSWDDAPEWTGIATKQAAYAFLGQSYLYEAGYLENGHGDVEVIASQGSASGAYEMAAKYFEMIISENKFSLVDYDVIGTMTTAGEFNDESIFEVNYTTEYNSDFTSVNNYLYNTFNMSFSNVGGYSTAVPAMWLADTYRDDPVDPLRDINWVQRKLDSDGDLILDISGTTWEIEDSDGTTTTRTTYVFQTSKNSGDGLPTIETRGSDGYDYLVFENTNLTELCTKVVTEEYVYDDVTGDTVLSVSDPTYTQIGNYNMEYCGAGEHDTEYVRVISSEGDPEDWVIYTLREDTPRMSYTIVTPRCRVVPYYLQPVWTASSFNNYSVGYFRWMTNWETIDDEDNTVPTQTSGINLRIMRLADVYLMYAECLAELGVTNRGYGSALDFINRIRYRAGAQLMGTANEYAGQVTYDGLTYSNDDIIEHIRWKERPMELTLEGHSMRVNDLRRWGMQKARFTELSNYVRYLGSIYIVQANSTTGLLANSSKSGTFSFAEREQIWTDHDGWSDWWGYTTVADYIDAAKNFTWKDNSYWPIPNNEVLANPYIN